LASTNPSRGVYKYKYLPLLAKSILNEHLHDFAVEQLLYARQYSVPLLKFLSHLSENQIIEISKTSLTEIFNYLINNNAALQISNSSQRWLTNQLEIVGKYDVAAEDITLIFHVRGKSLKNYASSCTMIFCNYTSCLMKSTIFC
jgi:hypothetical protein